MPRDSVEPEVSYFRYIRKLDGTLEAVDLARRNGRLVPRFHPSVTEAELTCDGQDSTEYQELVAELSYNLNLLERRTWLKLMDGQPIEHIAADEGVTRTAIYERIRGSS